MSFAAKPIADRVVVEDRGYETPCHIWTGGTNSQGYPNRTVGKVGISVHRAVYEEAHGKLPTRIDVHHLCEQKRCIRLDHLEARSRRSHMREHLGRECAEEALLRILREAGEPLRLREVRRRGAPHLNYAVQTAMRRGLVERVGFGTYALRVSPSEEDR